MKQSEVIDEAVMRIVRYFDPERVYLIGSTARGELRDQSDLDFLVVVPDDTPREKRSGGGVHEELYGIGVPIDVIPFRKSSFDAQADWLMSLPAIALREGLLLYDARPAQP